MLASHYTVNSAGPLSLAPNERAIRRISPIIPDAVLAESDRGPWKRNKNQTNNQLQEDNRETLPG